MYKIGLIKVYTASDAGKMGDSRSRAKANLRGLVSKVFGEEMYFRDDVGRAANSLNLRLGKETHDAYLKKWKLQTYVYIPSVTSELNFSDTRRIKNYKFMCTEPQAVEYAARLAGKNGFSAAERVKIPSQMISALFDVTGNSNNRKTHAKS